LRNRRDPCVEQQCGIIVLSTFDTETDVARAVKAGAKGYLLKDGPVGELLSSIRAVHGGALSKDVKPI
jgi:DNA-binding NarL/FixJ family response regulator